MWALQKTCYSEDIQRTPTDVFLQWFLDGRRISNWNGMSSPINADITLTDHSDTESLHSDVISEGGEIDSSDMEEGNITGCTYIDSNDKGRNVIIYTVITVIILIIVLHKSRKQNFHSDSGGLGALTQRGYSYTDQVSENQSNVMISMLIFWQASY